MSYQKSTSGKHIRKVVSTTGLLAPDGSPVVPVRITTNETGLLGAEAIAVSTTIAEGGPTTYVEATVSTAILDAYGRPIVPVIDVGGGLGGGGGSAGQATGMIISLTKAS